MKIAIVPVKVLTGANGLVTVTQVDVRCAAHELGLKARFSWEAQSVEPNPTQGGQPITTTRANGTLDLTAEQYAAWGLDDTAIAHVVVRAAGMEPAPVEPAAETPH